MPLGSTLSKADNSPTELHPVLPLVPNQSQVEYLKLQLHHDALMLRYSPRVPVRMAHPRMEHLDPNKCRSRTYAKTRQIRKNSVSGLDETTQTRTTRQERAFGNPHVSALVALCIASAQSAARHLDEDFASLGLRDREHLLTIVLDAAAHHGAHSLRNG
jgi:hypothetical protein